LSSQKASLLPGKKAKQTTESFAASELALRLANLLT
jgi:hypothetical protein